MYVDLAKMLPFGFNDDYLIQYKIMNVSIMEHFTVGVTNKICFFPKFPFPSLFLSILAVI